MDRRCRESEGKAKIEGYMSVSDEEAHQRDLQMGSQWVWYGQGVFLLFLNFLFLLSLAADILEVWWLIVVIHMLGRLGVELRVGILINLSKMMIYNMSFCEGYFVKVFAGPNAS